MRTKTFIIGVVVSILFVRCVGVFEKDISENVPVVITPTDSSEVNSFVNFLWEEMDGAKTYGLHVVSPTYDSIQEIVVDTIVTGTSFFTVLTPDRYQYTLTAFNNGYSSLETPPVTFFVDSSSSGEGQLALLQPLASKFYNTDFDGYFSWSQLNNVTSYEFSLRKGENYEIGEIVHTKNNISSNNVLLPSLDYEEGIYVWGVRAIFSSGQESAVFTNTFKIDGTLPRVPSLVSPTNESVVTSPVTFSWTNPSDVGDVKSPVDTRIVIATDSLFTSIYETQESSEQSEEIEIDETGTFYWRLKGVDEAGNESDYSEFNSFVIN